MEPTEFIVILTAIVAVLIGLPWLIFHYITKWKTAARLTGGDEKLLDELYDAARRLIMTAENPDWKRGIATSERSRLLTDGE